MPQLLPIGNSLDQLAVIPGMLPGCCGIQAIHPRNLAFRRSPIRRIDSLLTCRSLESTATKTGHRANLTQYR